MRISRVCIVVASFLFVSFADDSPKFGVNFLTNAFTLNNVDYGAKGLRNVGMLGARYFVNNRIGIDADIGAGMNSAVSADTAALTPKDPGITSVSGQVGIFWKLTPQEWQSHLGVVVNGGMSYQKWYDAVNLRDTTRVLPAPPAKDYVTYSVVQTYSVIVPFFFVGLEPSYSFDKHFSLYANFGVNGIFYPDSKSIDPRSYSTNNNYVTSLPMVERKDSSFELSISSIGLGVRYML